jgi:hypothetical protein
MAALVAASFPPFPPTEEEAPAPAPTEEEAPQDEEELMALSNKLNRVHKDRKCCDTFLLGVSGGNGSISLAARSAVGKSCWKACARSVTNRSQ